MPRRQAGPSVSGCPSASCSLVGFGCHSLQELGGTAKEFGLGLDSAQPSHVPVSVHMCLAHTWQWEGLSAGVQGPSRAAASYILEPDTQV